MDSNYVPLSSLALLVTSLILALWVAGGLLAVVAFAVAVDVWIRMLTPARAQGQARDEEDRGS